MRLYAIMNFLDDWVLIVGVYGILLTGIAYGLFTSFGFLRLRWVTLKWILTIAMILVGTFVMGPRIDQNALLSPTEIAQFTENLSSLRLWRLLQNGALLVVLWLSIFKLKPE